MLSICLVNCALRLHDNPCLKLANENSSKLLIIYQLPHNFNHLGDYRKAFIFETLASFKHDLKHLGQELFVCEHLDRLLSDLVSKYEDLRLYAHKPFNFYEQKLLEQLNIPTVEVEMASLYGSHLLPFSILDLPTTFTTFRKKIEAGSIEIVETPSITKLKPLPSNLKIAEFELGPVVKKNANFQGGEYAALYRLKDYLWQTHKIATYKETRNGMLDFNDSSKFSPWLSIGSLSAKRVYNEIKRYEGTCGANESTYWLYFELLWRDYFKFLSLQKGKHFFMPKLNYKEDSGLYNDWANANTGITFIDANMQELLTSGWMSNRGRQNVASYFCKELGLDWTLGANYFAQHLIDYDVESNWGNWAYLAGEGADPRDRKFNISRQAEIYDPKQEYQKKFLPNKFL